MAKIQTPSLCSWPSSSKVSGVIPSDPSSAALEHPLLPLAVRNVHNTPWSSFFDISQGASTLRGIHVITSFWLQSKKLRSNPAVISLKHPLLFPSTTTRLAYIGCCFFERSNERNKCLLLASFEVVFGTHNRTV